MNIRKIVGIIKAPGLTDLKKLDDALNEQVKELPGYLLEENARFMENAPSDIDDALELLENRYGRSDFFDALYERYGEEIYERMREVRRP